MGTVASRVLANHADPAMVVSVPEESGQGRTLGDRVRLGITGTVLLAGLAAALFTSAAGELTRQRLVILSGALSLLALLWASARHHLHPAPQWVAARRDPFLAFAAALVLIALPHCISVVSGGPPVGALGGYRWLTGALAAVFGAAGFLTMLRELAPGRVLDTLYLAVIAALSVVLTGWVGVIAAMDGEPVTAVQAMELLGPVALDLVVVALGLQVLHLRTRSRESCWLFLIGWTVVLSADASVLLAAVVGVSSSPGAAASASVVACTLLAGAALHPASSKTDEPVLGRFERLPRSQIALIAGAVVLGPVVLTLGIEAQQTRSLVVPLSGLLSLVVVAHLVRLVQGRAAFEHRAHHDELTGLANRTLFTDRAAVAIAHARRTGAHSAVLFLDLDRFKNVNDSLGHAVGNLLLQSVAKRLRGAVRAEDSVARLGGDEFVVFLPQLSDPEEAAHVAAKVLESFAEPFRLNGHRLFASPSIGIAVFPGDGDDSEALLKNADIAMYRAKERGRRTFCTYDRSMNDHAHERLALESRLHRAVEHGELRLHYQPKVHLPTGRVMGMEALLRWQHPELGLLEPSEFISLAEESGLIVPLGEWALKEACRQNQAWLAAGFAPLVVAVNLSLRQFQQQRIEDVTARILRDTGLDPELLELEVTESLATQDPDDVCATLLDLRLMGVKCSIDDFGTGYSGLSHLTQLPIDKLKIDKSFVATIDDDREAPIVMAVVALAHGLGLEVVAEGVETPQQLDRLRELGCDEMQGFLFSRPLTSERFEQMLMLESVSAGPGRLVLPHMGVSPRPGTRLEVAG